VDALDGQVSSPMLAARIKLDRHHSATPPFVLDVSIRVPPGITILFGPSGAGKSTLLDCIAGLVTPEAGHIAVAEDLLFDAQRHLNLPAQARRVAYVFQTLALFPHMTAEENVAYGLASLPAENRAARVDAALQALGVAALRARKPAQISGGERQRIALARSLVTEPRVLLLDEPLSGLDAHITAGIVNDLRAWNATHKIPILYVTHSREEAAALGERVIAMDQGRVTSEGSPLEVLEAPRRKRLAQTAGFENLLDGKVIELHESDGTMRVQLGENHCEIEVPLGFATVGDAVCVAIRAGDILLATEPPQRLSARNVLEGEIRRLETRGVVTEAVVKCGADFFVHVTPGAARELQLAPGKRVWLVLKTHSCHLVGN
jgi:molybdate transport system ATP-binding protein